MSNPSVSFSVNVCITDVPYLYKVMTHMVKALNYPFVERRLTIDPGKVEGKYADRHKGQLDELYTIVEKLKSEKIIDSYDVIPWTQESQNEILERYFSNKNIELKDFSGAPIYQYLYALAPIKSDYIFHADSDMLFYTNHGNFDWISRSIDYMKSHKDVVFTTPMGGPPIARYWYEKLLKKSFQKSKDTWHHAEFISTRYFLMDRRRFEEKVLPLKQEKPSEPLEDSISYTAKLKGLKRMSMDTFEAYAVHPWQHDINFITHLDKLIWAVENNIYPVVRKGFQWDMRTDGDNINDWLKAIKKYHNE